jgi:hypothetical protein
MNMILKDRASFFKKILEKTPVWSLPYTYKGTSPWEEEHSLYP